MLTKEELEKIDRYVNGLSDNTENSYVESLFKNGENSNNLRNLLQEDWDLSPGVESAAFEADKKHILERIHLGISKKERLNRQQYFPKIVRYYMQAASFLLLPLLVSGILVYSYLSLHNKAKADGRVSATIYAPLGSRVSFNLPDGTKGMLNSGSHLSYSLPFASDRQIDLEGEAWFEVAEDKDHPFEISAGNSIVKVVGTCFNLSAYPAENYVEVVLQKGKVEFQASGGDKKVTLLPSERLVFRNGDIRKTVTDPAKYNAWTKGKLVFRGDPMAEVGRRIERWYNVKVDLADKEIEKYSFRATFEDDKLEEVLRLLSMTSPIRYHITPARLLADGTCERGKLTIYLRR